MSLIYLLPSILEESRSEYQEIKNSIPGGRSFCPVERINHTEEESASLLARGDNLEFIQYLIREKELEGKIQLIYMDPPFYSKASYDAVIKLRANETFPENMIRYCFMERARSIIFSLFRKSPIIGATNLTDLRASKSIRMNWAGIRWSI